MKTDVCEIQIAVILKLTASLNIVFENIKTHVSIVLSMSSLKYLTKKKKKQQYIFY